MNRFRKAFGYSSVAIGLASVVAINIGWLYEGSTLSKFAEHGGMQFAVIALYSGAIALLLDQQKTLRGKA